MSSSSPTPSSHSVAGRWVCWLFVAALLVRTFWVPYHLATEPHYHPLAASLAAHAVANDQHEPGTGSLIAPSEELGGHSALDHSRPPHPRPGDEDERLGDAPAMLPVARLPLPSPGLFAGWLDLTRTCAAAAAPRVVAAAPRAPPVG